MTSGSQRVVWMGVLILLLTKLAGWSQQVTHGPVVGGVTSGSAVFVVRVDAPADVQLELSPVNTFAYALRTASALADEENYYFVKLYAGGLQPETEYFYRVVINGVPATTLPAGRFRTFPPDGQPTPFTFLTGSCQQAGDDPFSSIGNIFYRMAREDALFLLHQGDWGYPDTTDEEAGRPGDYFPLVYDRVVETYFSKYDPGYPMAELFKRMPVDYAYDDHDMVDNNSDYTYPGIANSIRGYREMFPHYPLPNADDGVWHRFTCGNAEFFVVDNRSQRDPNINAFTIIPPNEFVADTIVSFRAGPDHRLLTANPMVTGEDQISWLLRALKNSQADWKFISTGTPFNPGMRGVIELAVLLQGDPDYAEIPTPAGPLTPTEIAVEFSDKWAGFPVTVHRLLAFIIEHRIENVIFLSGDIHTSAIDDGANSLIPELVSGPLDRTNSQTVALMEQFGIYIYNKGGHTADQSDMGNAYGRVTVFGRDSVRLEVVSESGALLARHTVQAGFVPARVGATVVPLTLDFGGVPVGSQETQPLIVVSTSIDPLVVTQIVSSDPRRFQVVPRHFTVYPGLKQRLAVIYTPDTNEKHEATLTIYSNDPDGPITVTVQGHGIDVFGRADRTLTTGLPQRFALHPNYPNPFNPATTIRYALAEEVQVRLTIYNSLGQTIRTLVSDFQEAGDYRVVWDGRDDSGRSVTSGVYVYELQAGDFVARRKMMLLK